MEFLGFGYQELILILILLLVVVGPERLPQMAYQVGRAVRQMQLYARSVRDEFRDEIGYLDEQYRTMRGEIELAQKSIREEQAALRQGLAEVDAELKAADADASQALAVPANAGPAIPEAVTASEPTRRAGSDTPAPPLVF